MYSLPIPLLFAITIIACFTRSLFGGGYSKRVSSSDYHTWLFSALQSVFCLVTIIGIFLVSGGLGEFSLFSILMGVLMGAISCVCNTVLTLKAYAIGPFTYTVIITSLGSIIATLSGFFFPNDPNPTLTQYVGVVLMVICLCLSPESNQTDKEKKASLKWLLLCVIAAVCSGATGIIQKIHQSTAHSNEQAAMLIGAFAFSSVFSVITFLCQKREGEQSEKSASAIVVWGIPAASGFLFAFQHSINLKLSSGPAIIVFPLLNLLPMILSMTTGLVIFKEKLTLKRWIGLICGIAATIFVSGII